jgi:hypothetical protein
MLLDRLTRIAVDLRDTLGTLDPDRLSGADADRLLGAFAEIEKLAVGGRLLAARRVESSNVWRRKGHRSAAAHVAEATGTALGPAVGALEAARQLQGLPATEEAVRQGRLSEAQVREIAGAAADHPEAELQLVEAATHQPLSVLKLRCRRVKAEGADHQAAYDRIHRERYLRSWSDPDGAVRFDARLTPDAGARLLAAVRAESERLAADAARAGVDVARRALDADALVELVDPHRDGAAGAGPGRTGGPSTMVHVRVDRAALVRGHTEPGEVCEIPGVGPIPVEVARRLSLDSMLCVLVTDGVDVTSVSHARRFLPAALRRALMERDGTCVVPGCDRRDGLEIDHVLPVVDGGPTELANLALLCRWHHYLKTFHGHRLRRGDLGWEWDGPDRPLAPTSRRARAG